MSLYEFHVERPDGYDKNSNKVYPLIMFLHGHGQIGGQGDKKYLQQVKYHGPWKEHGCDKYSRGAEAITRIGQFFIAAPHLPGVTEWDAEKVHEVLVAVLNHPEYGKSIDRDRLYLTGISWGGRGALRVALSDPKRFAAIAPVCPYGASEFLNEIHKLRDVPVWLFHGAKDGLEEDGKPKAARLSKNSEDLCAKLRGSGSSNVRLTIYPDEGHSGAWIKAYDDPELYDWLLKQTKPKQSG